MTRRIHDFYETAPWQVDALVDNLAELSGTVFCPCVGDGSLMRRLSDRLPDLRFVTNDIDTNREADFHFDATVRAHWHQAERLADWVIENPPFNVEIEILKHAFRFSRLGVVFMSRVSFAEPTKDRGPWLAQHPYQKRITLERHSFTGNGSTDSATTDWLVWAKIPLVGPFGISAYGYRNGRGAEPVSVGAVREETDQPVVSTRVKGSSSCDVRTDRGGLEQP